MKITKNELGELNQKGKVELRVNNLGKEDWITLEVKND